MKTKMTATPIYVKTIQNLPQNHQPIVMEVGTFHWKLRPIIVCAGL